MNSGRLRKSRLSAVAPGSAGGSLTQSAKSHDSRRARLLAAEVLPACVRFEAFPVFFPVGLESIDHGIYAT